MRDRKVNLPAILMTSHPKPSFREAAAIAGVPILEKPLEGATLIDAIYDLLDTKAV